MRVWLKKYREDAGMKQEEVATKAGISRTMYAHIETGFRDASVQNAKRIGEALNFDWIIFFDDTFHESKNKEKEAVKQ